MIVKNVIRSRKSEKNKRHNGQDKKEEKTNNDLQNTTAKQHELHKNTGMKLAVRNGSSSCSTNITSIISSCKI